MTHQMPLYTEEHRETTKIFHRMCHQCRFGVASDAKHFWKIMVVVVFGPSLIKVATNLLEDSGISKT